MALEAGSLDGMTAQELGDRIMHVAGVLGDSAKRAEQTGGDFNAGRAAQSYYAITLLLGLKLGEVKAALEGGNNGNRQAGA